MKDHVILKSSKYGLTVYLDQELSFQELLMEIEMKFRASAHFFDGMDVAVSFENRMLTKEEEQEIVKLISDTANIRILCIMDTDESVRRMYKGIVDESLALIPEPDGLFYKGTLKKRQVLESETSVIIIGDVEEGAMVAARGNVVVIGTIYGSIHAGAAGRQDAFIAALDMEPVRLRIGEKEVKPVIGGSYSWARLS